MGNSENKTSKKISNKFPTFIFDKKLFEWFDIERKRFCIIQDVNIKKNALE